MLQSSKAFVCQLHHKMLQSSQLLFGTQKLAPNSQHQKKCFQSSKLLFGTQKLAPNSNTKCFKAQSFCLALKKKAYTQLIAQQKCSKTQSFCLALKSLHPIIGNASKLQIHPSNFFKMRQDPEKKKKTPSKHHHQNTKHSPYHHEEESSKKKKKNKKMQQKSNNIKKFKRKECEVNFIT
jgi:hypothetical protein